MAAVAYYNPIVGAKIHWIFAVAFDDVVGFEIIITSTDYTLMMFLQKVPCPGLQLPVDLSRMDFLI